MKQQKIENISCGGDWDPLERLFVHLFIIAVGKNWRIRKYVNGRSVIFIRRPFCGLRHTPDYVVYHELVMTNKEYMRSEAAMEGEWL